MEGVQYGAFIQDLAVKSGERYAVLAKVRSTGAAVPYVRVRWVDALGQWAPESEDAILTGPLPMKNAEGDWEEVSDVVIAPAGAARLVLMLGVTGQTSVEEKAWFDDVHLYPLLFSR